MPVPAIDPQIFSIQRPQLERYHCVAQRDIIVETYSSAAGQMESQGSLHRISLNRTAHRRYAYRAGGDVFRAVQRPPFTLALQPANTALEIDGDAADYISIFQSPDLYRGVGGDAFRPEDWDHEALSASVDPLTLHIALSLAVAAESPGPKDALLMEHLGLSLACCVVKLLGARLPAVPLPAPHALEPQRLRRVVDYVECQLAKADLSVEELAAIAHLSPYHFSRAFRAATGRAPHRFVLERRVQRAQLLLADGGDTLADIAYATGFSSQAHFSSMFRRHTGMTPRQYRQSVRA
jgi:AraC family transcriptional regulator